MRDIFIKLISSRSGVSSKRFIGTLGYIVLLVSMIALAFINPFFPGIDDILIALIITSASLLGITTLENISKKSLDTKTDDDDKSKEKTV